MRVAIIGNSGSGKSTLADELPDVAVWPCSTSTRWPGTGSDHVVAAPPQPAPMCAPSAMRGVGRGRLLSRPGGRIAGLRGDRGLPRPRRRGLPAHCRQRPWEPPSTRRRQPG